MLSVTINSKLTSLSRIVAGVCMITVSLRALCGDVDCRGAAAGLSVGGCVLHAARCGEMTPPPRPWLLSSSYTRVYQVIPGGALNRTARFTDDNYVH